jgi:hypothetical protein
VPSALALAGLLAGSGCLPSRTHPTEEELPTPVSEWSAVYARITADTSATRAFGADRALAEFAQRFPSSPEAAEVPYWRALFKLDPNSTAAMRESMTLLDGYLTTAPAGTHRLEAGVLRRLGLAIEQRNAAIAAIPPALAAHPEDKAREEELQRLRDDLAAANAELARIRRRVARPRP